MSFNKSAIELRVDFRNPKTATEIDFITIQET